MAMNYSIREGIWIQKFLNKLLLKQVIRRIKMFGGKEKCLMLTKDLESQKYTKYINVIYHYI